MHNAEGDPGTFLIPILLANFTANAAWELSCIAVLIFLSAMISGSESAFFSLKNKDLIDLQEKKTRSTLTVVRLLSEPKLLLATILIVNTLINISVAILAAQLTTQLFSDSEVNEAIRFLVEVISVTFSLVLLGEVTPKIYAAQHSAAFATAMAFPILLLTRLFYPLAYFLTRTTHVIEKRIDKRGHDLKIEEIKQAIELTSNALTTQDEKKILRSIISFGTTYVKQIMTPRMDVVAHEYDTPFNELVKSINENRYSRLPIYQETLDKIEGILYIKDLIPYLNESDDFNWQSLVRKAYFVPDSKKIDVLLEEFQSKKMHMAIVVDEYGGTAGIISLEDILEEIVGDINDEFDEDELQYSRMDDTTCVFNGKTSLNDVIRIMNLDDDVFENVRGEAETIGGLLVEMSGKIPILGETVSFSNFIFTVESADRKRVRRVKMSILAPDIATEENAV